MFLQVAVAAGAQEFVGVRRYFCRPLLVQSRCSAHTNLLPGAVLGGLCAKVARQLLAALPVVIATGSYARLPGQAALGLDFATWVAIASISAGDRQS
jgi:hypothetical protein